MTRAFSILSCLALSALLSAALLAADAKPTDAKPAEAKNLLKPVAEVASWRLEQHEEAKASIASADGAIVFDVTKDDGTDWHVQAFQTPIELKDNTEYVVSFKGKSDGERTMRVQAGIDQDDWHLVGLDEEVTLGKEWKDYETKFTASDTVAMKNRFGFVLGMAKGKVYVKDLVLKPVK